MYTFEGVQFIFYKDEFKVYLNTLEEMRLPLVTWFSVAPNVNRNMVQIVDSTLAQMWLKMFSEFEIEILQGV